MNEDEAFFFGEAIRHARSLPLNMCLQFLQGMLAAMEEDHATTKLIRSIIAQLTASDAQLDLIEIGQLRLSIDIDSHKPPPRRQPGKKGTQ